ncbi:holo-ACP synthase [bacterium]|nr:holo-ACP synthase [bacterium]
MITVGTDIIDVARITKKRDAVISRVLIDKERGYCLSSGNPDQSLAGHFAAKEAVYKALRINNDNGISWKEIEIIHLNSGAPSVVLHNKAKKYADSNGMINIQISISHVKDFATATAVCEWLSG